MGEILKTLGIALLVTIACLGFGCVGSMPPPQNFQSMERTAGNGESEIIITRSSRFTGSAVGIRVVVDGQERLMLSNGENRTITVPNGKRSIYTERSWGGSGCRSDGFTLDLESSRIVFQTGFGGRCIQLMKVAEFSLDGSNIPTQRGRTTSNQKARGLEDAIKNVSNSLVDELPNGSKIAVVSVTSKDRQESSLVIDELEFYLVSARSFTVVDRSTLDAIRREQNFQMSGDVSDASVVAIGEMSGASVVIAGSITTVGGTNRLSLKALDVKTGQIIAMVRESY